MHRLSLLLLPALVAACQPMAAPAASPPAAAPPSAPMAMATGFPMATYTTTMVAADVPAGAPADMASQLVGSWTIAFGDNGHAMVSLNGRQMVDAPFTVSGNVLTLTEDTGEYACHSTARYNWHATATELHLSKLEDACDGRAAVLTAHPLVRR